MPIDIEPTDSGFRISSKIVGYLLPESDYDKMIAAKEFARATWRCRTREDVIALAKEWDIALNFVE
jgi:hypothetical protein